MNNTELETTAYGTCRALYRTVRTDDLAAKYGIPETDFDSIHAALRNGDANIDSKVGHSETTNTFHPQWKNDSPVPEFVLAYMAGVVFGIFTGLSFWGFQNSGYQDHLDLAAGIIFGLFTIYFLIFGNCEVADGFAPRTVWVKPDDDSQLNHELAQRIELARCHNITLTSGKDNCIAMLNRCIPENQAEAADLLRLADDALYAASTTQGFRQRHQLNKAADDLLHRFDVLCAMKEAPKMITDGTDTEPVMVMDVDQILRDAEARTGQAPTWNSYLEPEQIKRIKKAK